MNKAKNIMGGAFAAAAVALVVMCPATGAGAEGGRPGGDATHGAKRRQMFNPEAGYVTHITKEGRKVLLLDLRGADASDLLPELSRIQQNFEVAFEVKPGPADGDARQAAFAALAGDDGVGAVVALADEGDGSPTLSVFPEDQVTVLNVARLRRSLPENADEARATLAVRLKKELWRAVAFSLGGYENEYPCVMKGVFSMEDLDANKMEMACPLVWGRVSAHAKRLGLARAQTVPYFMALRKGWAPAPTNDAQRVEFERFQKVKAAQQAKMAATNEAAKAEGPAQ
ncbi:MAG: hypothetical protein ILM98_06435 [Kiritimatiellae bacterium]|nr:hypothetical protein [Kiritimatiellia bacterium]